MKKKIEDLTLKECLKLCVKFHCINCPLCLGKVRFKDKFEYVCYCDYLKTRMLLKYFNLKKVIEVVE